MGNLKNIHQTVRSAPELLLNVVATPPSRSTSISKKFDGGVASTLQNLPAEFLNVGRASRLPASGSKRDACATYLEERIDAGLQSGRNFVIPDQREQVSDNNEFEPITWLMIKG